MSHQSVVRRYARALYEEAAQDPRIGRDMALVRQTVLDEPAFAAYLQSPVVAREAKKSAVTAIFGENLHPLSIRFLRLVIARKREYLLPAMAAFYAELSDIKSGITTAYVRTCFALSDAERAKLAAALEQRLANRIRLVIEMDTSLVGGMVVRIGDVVYDGSVRHQLERLRASMTST